MTTKNPEPPQDAGSSTSSVPAQPKPPVEQTTAAQPAVAPPASAPTPAATQPAKTAGAAKATGAAKAPAPPARPAAPTRPAPAPIQRGSSAGGAVALAILALLVAVGATGVAIYSLDVAREAKSQAAPTAAAGQAAPGATPTATAAAPAATTGAPTQGPTFVSDLVRAEVQLPPTQSCNSIYVDVDTLQVGVLAGHEFSLSSCLGPTSFRIDRTSGAAPASTSPSPEVCAAQLAGSTAQELVLQARAGLTFCLLTNKTDATQQGIPQRIAIVEVRDLKSDGAVTLAVSTYRVPNQT